MPLPAFLISCFLQSGMESAQRRTKDKKGQFGGMT